MPSSGSGGGSDLLSSMRHVISAHNRARAFTDSNSSANILIAGILDHHRAGVFMTDARVEVFEAGVFLNRSRGTAHGPNSTSHVAVANVSVDQRRTAAILGRLNRDPRIADMVHDVICDRAARDRTRSDPWRPWGANRFFGLLFSLCFRWFGLTLATPIAMLFVSLMVTLALIDAEHYILPDKLTYPGTAAGLLLSFWSPFTTPVGSLLGVAVGAGSLLLLIGLWYLVRRQMGMGLGDPKMLATIGSFLGVGGVVVTLFASSILGSVVGVALIQGDEGTL